MTDPDRPTRRALLGAGVLGAALAAAGSHAAAASPADHDDALIGFAIGFELAARDLYEIAIDAGADDDLWSVLREQHDSYAQRLSGISGISANTPNAELIDTYGDAFATSDPAEPALELENTTAATNVDLLGQVVNVDAAGAMASIAAIESHQAALLAVMTGGDLDAVLTNPATPLSPEVTS